MQHHDPHDQLAGIWSESDQYIMPHADEREPLDFLEAQRLWDSFNDQENVATLFHTPGAKLDVWETGLRNKFPDNVLSLSNLDAIRKHFIRSEKDPHIRHVFIGSNDSRSPMNCSPEIFRFICAYHQVEPFFLEAAHSFRRQPYPIDYCLAHFRSKTIAGRTVPRSHALPKFGRSGNAIHVSYLLRSVEHSGERGIEGWQIRQAANYHSFDLETGRSFWFTIKANNLFKNRIKQFTPRLKVPPGKSTPDTNISHHLKASLDTHLLYFSWCDEGWRSFIDDFETSMRTTVLPAKVALVDDHIDLDGSQNTILPWDLLRRKQEMRHQTALSRLRSSYNKELTYSTVKERIISYSRSIFVPRRTTTDEEKGNPSSSTGLPHQNSYKQLDPSGSLNKLRVKDIQSLSSRSELIQKVLIVLKLNVGVLHDTHVYYTTLIKAKQEDKNCREVINNFLSRLKGIRRSLETRREQLSSLATSLEHNIQLYELVLHQRYNQIQLDFAGFALESNIQMNRVASKTSKQTASMHFITIVTLIFLPATFVATFLQSGVLAQNDTTGAFSFRSESFKLFSVVCGLLTAITIGAWSTIFLRFRSKTRKQARAVLDQVPATSA